MTCSRLMSVRVNGVGSSGPQSYACASRMSRVRGTRMFMGVCVDGKYVWKMLACSSALNKCEACKHRGKWVHALFVEAAERLLC